jgi:hypothetical protein
MSVQSLKSRFLVATALVLSAAPLFALNPSARSEARMVYSPALHRTVLYGGSSPVDRGTKLAYELSDTWERTITQWVQRFPAHNPGPRAAQVMVYDPTQSRILLFGGRTGTSFFNDLWSYQNDDWTKINTATTPGARFLAGGAFDTVRNRLVVFGGYQYTPDPKSSTPLSTPIYDTWEFDGTNWRQTNTNGPQVLKPILVYDAARDNIIMLGINDKSESLMYQYDAAAGSWKQLTPATLPACLNEGMAVYNDATQKVFYTGGVCATSSATEDNLEWDGTTWTKVDVILSAGRLFGSAIAYDTDRQQVVLFGGANVLNTIRSATLLFSSGNWIDVSFTNLDPQPRSLMAFVTDPVNNTIWMFGGVNDEQNFLDFWKFQNGHWEEIANGDEPVSCTYPLAAYDTDRQKIVMVCEDSSTWEHDGTGWKQATLKAAPTSRRFASLAYDPTLKKTILFGGYDTTTATYLDQTWTWDGSTWTRVKKNPPPSRALASMWYDSTLKKTVIYGGIGRITSTDRVTRYDDMWTFDGTAWTQLKPSGGTPGLRYGAETTVDPRTNKVVLFGGLRVDTDAAGLQTQVYADDTWEWDGTAWKKLAPDVVPPARENAGLTFDPIRNELVMFSGFSGTYHADTWGYTNGAWHQRIESSSRRRSAR